MSSFKPLLLESAEIVSRILPGVKLRDYQVRAAIHVALLDSQLIAFDTGLGKTMSLVAGLVAKKNLKHYPRTLILCPLAGMQQFYSTIKKHTKLKVKKLSGSKDGLDNFNKEFTLDLDVLLCNYEAFDNPEVLEIMHTLMVSDYFNTIVLDEAHTIANLYSSNRNFFIANLTLSMRNRYALTATPIISEVRQYAAILALLEGDIHGIGRFTNRVKAGEYQYTRIPNFVQFKERKEQYKVELHKFPARNVPKSLYGTEIFKHTRGPKNRDVEDKLKELITSIPGKLLIYSHLTTHHQYLASIAESLGRKAGVISGDSNKELVQKQFNDGDIDTVIYSIPTELNLPASSVIIYDWTSMVHQAIGRGIRSESAKDYVAHVFLTETPRELSLFQNSVIKNSLYLSESFGKDIDELLKLNQNQ